MGGRSGRENLKIELLLGKFRESLRGRSPKFRPMEVHRWGKGTNGYGLSRSVTCKHGNAKSRATEDCRYIEGRR